MIPTKYQLAKVNPNKIIENQLNWGNRLYKFETIMPKSIFGVAEPLIINSGDPVYRPESQFWIITSSLTP
jgi:hypothetical protein